MGRALHPRLTAARRRQLVRRGCALFDGGHFFAAHECWEEVWRSTDPEPRELWQGLVQLAAAFHHLRARRLPDVAARVLAKARRRLEVVPPGDHEVDVAALLPQLAAWTAWLAGAAAPVTEAAAEPPAVRLGQPSAPGERRSDLGAPGG